MNDDARVRAETVEDATEMLADVLVRNDFGDWIRRKLDGHESVSLKLLFKHDRQGGYIINLSATQVTRQINMRTLIKLT